MTIQQLTNKLRQIYRDSQICEFADFRHFCDAVFESVGISKEYRLMNPENEVDGDSALLNAQKIKNGTPLEYITGKASFYKEEYAVGDGVLIPRSDSECLVEEAVKLVPHGAVFADICSGSGCLGISLLCARPDLRGIACDVSPTALYYTALNAERLGVADRLTVKRHDLLAEKLEGVDFVISNPPYIKSSLIDTLPANVKKEPSLALDGGEDGMTFYRALKEKYCGKLPAIIEIGEEWQNIFENSHVIFDTKGKPRAVYTLPEI